jgi:hypothetical protein
MILNTGRPGVLHPGGGSHHIFVKVDSRMPSRVFPVLMSDLTATGWFKLRLEKFALLWQTEARVTWVTN